METMRWVRPAIDMDVCPQTQGSPSVFRIFIERIGTGAKGDVYRAIYGCDVIIERSRFPFLPLPESFPRRRISTGGL